jgi:methionyl-tRNA formyltransferase
MRIALIGQAAFGEKVFEALLGADEEIVAVYTPPDASPGKSNTLVALAESHGIPTRQPAKMRALDVFEDYRRFKADLNVMAFVTDVVPSSILGFPALGTIQYHPSLLPRHRGASAINWAIINGETKTGLSIFWPDEGLDTGPLLLQKEVAIEPDDTLGTVYFGKLFPLGVEALLESVRLVKEGKAARLPQDVTQGEYEPVCKGMKIDWMYPVTIVYNLIRGCNPSPGAATAFRGQEVKIFDCQKLPGSGRQAPGTVLEFSPESLLVAANGGTILVTRVQPAGAGKMTIEEFVAATGLKVGDRLG